MASQPIIQAQTRKSWFFTLQILSLLLLASWLAPQGKQIWITVDSQVYRLLNGSLGSWVVWDFFWALLSTRIADVLAGGAMLVSLLYKDFIFQQLQLKKALLTFISLLFIMLLIRWFFTRLITQLGLQHASPSVFFGDGLQLSKSFPWMEQYLEVKDRSSRSFPGDHASVLLLWVLFAGFFARGKQRWLVFIAGIIFMLPRLIAGAHWLSDNLVGGLFLALQSIAWGYCTPLAAAIAKRLNRCASPILIGLQQVPAINRLTVIRAENRR